MPDSHPVMSLSHMLPMLRLDLLSMCSAWQLLAVFLGCGLVAGASFGALPAMLFLFIMGTVVCLSLFQMDELAGLRLLYDSLPLRRSDVVRARYLFVLVLMASFALVGSVLVALDSLRDGAPTYVALAGVVGAFAMVQSFLIPVILRYGVRKASVIVGLSCAAVVGALAAVGPQALPWVLLRDLPTEVSASAVVAVAAVAVALVFGVSYRISLWVYEHQDH